MAEHSCKQRQAWTVAIADISSHKLSCRTLPPHQSGCTIYRTVSQACEEQGNGVLYCKSYRLQKETNYVRSNHLLKIVGGILIREPLTMSLPLEHSSLSCRISRQRAGVHR